MVVNVSPLVLFSSFAFVLRASSSGGEARDVALSEARSTFEGLELTRLHAATVKSDGLELRPSLMSELVEATCLEFFIRSFRKHERDAAALHLVFDVSEPVDLPLMLASNDDEPARDRVIFRKARLVHRGRTHWPRG